MSPTISFVMPRQNVTVTPNFTPNIYTISYQLNGGQNSAENPDNYTYSIGVASFENARKSGYIFEGWYSDENLTNKVTQISTSRVDDITLQAKFVTVNDSNTTSSSSSNSENSSSNIPDSSSSSSISSSSTSSTVTNSQSNSANTGANSTSRNANSPKTGDSSSLALMVIILSAAVLGLCVIVFVKFSRRTKQ